ncbi:hypothetical protein COOONC_28092 [Cooperia oncophora]
MGVPAHYNPTCRGTSHRLETVVYHKHKDGKGKEAYVVKRSPAVGEYSIQNIDDPRKKAKMPHWWKYRKPVEFGNGTGCRGYPILVNYQVQQQSSEVHKNLHLSEEEVAKTTAEDLGLAQVSHYVVNG